MSSLRNAVQRRNHRERAQPTERSKHGLLEKRKDYQLRAADHKSKKRRIKALQEKARDRNEDEFYFGMMSSRTEGGVKVAKRGVESGGAAKLSPEVIELMKTQDVAYLRTVLQSTRRERERVEEDVVVGEIGVDVRPEGGAGRKVVFGEDGLAVRAAALPKKQIQDDDDWDFDDEEDSDAESEADKEEVAPEVRLEQKAQEVKRRKLEGLRTREKELAIALREVEDQRAKSNGTMGGVTKDGKRLKVPRRR